ncbi:MAG: energy transducer TonB [Acidobacteriaceae bacterium]
MRDSCALLVLFFCLIFPAAALRAQTQPATAAPVPSTTPAPTAANPKTPAEFFARARQLSDLEATGIPFHLKATFVASGAANYKANGTYEVWWKDKDHWRKEASVRDSQSLLIKNGGQVVPYGTSGYLISSIFPADFSVFEPPNKKWKIHRKKLNATEFFLVSKQNSCGESRCLTEYFFEPNGLLLAGVTRMLVTKYSNFHKFHDLLVPHRINVSVGTKPILSVDVNLLEEVDANDRLDSTIAAVPPDMHPRPASRFIVVSSAVANSRIIHQVPPIYPLEARQQRIQGTVVLSAVIDKNGEVQELHLIQSAGSLLDEAAQQAVRQWKYKPTVLDGVPVEVKTMISVVFTLNL